MWTGLGSLEVGVDWIWESGIGFCCYLLLLEALICILIAIYMVLRSPGKASGANPHVSPVSKTSVAWPGEANLHVPVLPQGLGSPELQSQSPWQLGSPELGLCLACPA